MRAWPSCECRTARRDPSAPATGPVGSGGRSPSRAVASRPCDKQGHCQSRRPRGSALMPRSREAGCCQARRNRSSALNGRRPPQDRPGRRGTSQPSASHCRSTASKIGASDERSHSCASPSNAAQSAGGTVSTPYPPNEPSPPLVAARDRSVMNTKPSPRPVHRVATAPPRPSIPPPGSTAAIGRSRYRICRGSAHGHAQRAEPHGRVSHSPGRVQLPGWRPCGRRCLPVTGRTPLA